ncbi:MAG: UvrD-helicase domain-containing protein, partial [Candidatus Hydrogenedentes bacterium]|nr:UvrD-helicase domain-containing protein [Candidatus Hydrogenedentota bacterium]
MSRTDAQQKAITAERKMLCVDAGAGSGKTLVLVERIVHLIEQKKTDLDGIVAITFTDKAAAEMKARLRRAFREKAPIDDPGEMTRWRDMERRVETARIGTIHSFCASLLREHALRIGMDPDFVVLTEAEAALLRNETSVEAVHERLEAGDPAAMRAATEYGPAKLIEELDALLAKRGVLERLGADLPLHDPEALAGCWVDLSREAHEQRLKTFARSHEVRSLIERLKSFDGLCEKPADGREVKRLEQIDLLEELRDAEHTVTINTCLGGMASPPRL